jgi:dienelactone hydrolase
MNIFDRLLVASALVAGLWWALSRRRRPTDLQRLSVAVFVLAVATFAFDGPHWQMVPWQVLAVSVAVAAALRRWRPGMSHRSLRIIGRGALGAGLIVGSLALLTAFVPSLPQPSGAHQVGSEIFRWTDSTRPETLTSNASDHRQVVAQAWYPADSRTGRPVPYFEAQDKLPGSIGGLPSFIYASFGKIATHATFEVPVSSDHQAWPVLVFSPGLSIPREAYTALCSDLASRGYVVIALSTPYESAPTVLAGGRVIGQTAHPDVMGPAPHPELERLIDIRAADTSFVLDRLMALAEERPSSPLAGHLDLRHVGIVGHSLGGATAVQAMAADVRFKVGVNLDGKLVGSQPDAHLDRPLLWIESDGPQTDEYTRGRDRLLAGRGDSGSLVTVGGSVHMSFSDDPAYWTATGRSLVGSAAGAGSISVTDMTAMTGDTIAAFVAPALGVAGAPTMNQVLARYRAIRADRGIPSRHF